MITDTSWAIVRRPAEQLPRPWQLVICKRNMTTEVLPGVTERRFVFAMDTHSGNRWYRQGSGQYDYWFDFPPVEEWCPGHILPPLGALCLFWLQSGESEGLQIGRVVRDALHNETWQTRNPYGSTWTTVFSKHIGTWLLLPPAATSQPTQPRPTTANRR